MPDLFDWVWSLVPWENRTNNLTMFPGSSPLLRSQNRTGPFFPIVPTTFLEIHSHLFFLRNPVDKQIKQAEVKAVGSISQPHQWHGAGDGNTSQSAGPPLPSRLKYLNLYLTDCHKNLCGDIQAAQRLNPADFGDPLTFPSTPPAGQGFHLACEISPDLRIDWHMDLAQIFMLILDPTDPGDPLTSIPTPS